MMSRSERQGQVRPGTESSARLLPANNRLPTPAVHGNPVFACPRAAAAFLDCPAPARGFSFPPSPAHSTIAWALSTTGWTRLRWRLLPSTVAPPAVLAPLWWRAPLEKPSGLRPFRGHAERHLDSRISAGVLTAISMGGRQGGGFDNRNCPNLIDQSEVAFAMNPGPPALRGFEPATILRALLRSRAQPARSCSARSRIRTIRSFPRPASPRPRGRDFGRQYPVH